MARIAAGLIRESWRYLSDRFQYKPSIKVPYILYNTYREFLETNVFPVQEGVLGVTSPRTCACRCRTPASARCSSSSPRTR